ncbi:MAG: hypothetical protein K9L98_02415 [Candidatus Pacebacteria bacterium]|nr:hypothetical protein [Candidatus Paceibacterota bacterium]MCF7862840.1 hypothetical protein [Candidatus Paceibacterota bacterium]
MVIKVEYLGAQPDKEAVKNLINKVRYAKGYMYPQGANDIEFPSLDSFLDILQKENLTLEEFNKVQKNFEAMMNSKQER